MNDSDNGRDDGKVNNDVDNTYDLSISTSFTHRRGSEAKDEDEIPTQHTSEEKDETLSQVREGQGEGKAAERRVLGSLGGGEDMFDALYTRLLLHQTQQQQLPHGFISTHIYTLDDTCSMTPLELQQILSPIYDKYADKF